MAGVGRPLSGATLDRVQYEHRLSAEERVASAQRAANRRMSVAYGGEETSEDVVQVRLIEERPAEAAAVAGDRAQDARREARRERRERRRAEKEAERVRKEIEAAKLLEDTARRMFYAGFLGLPMLWLVSLIYFHKEHKAEEANVQIKKYYKLTIIMFTVYTAIFVGWVIVFQLFANTTFRTINILHSNVMSPSRL